MNVGLVPNHQVPPATALQHPNKPFLLPEMWDQSFQGIHEEEGVQDTYLAAHKHYCM